MSLIPLTNKLGIVIDYATVDRRDAVILNSYRWRRSSNGYAVRTTRPWHSDKVIFHMHRVIMGLPNRENGGPIVDHKNANKLDNRRSNLRICNRSQNMANNKLRSDNTSGHKGVYYDKKSGNWRSMVAFKGNIKWLGFFRNKSGAIRARKAAFTALYGQFASDGRKRAA